MNRQTVKQSLDYLHSELNRVQTIVGTLSTTEQEHLKKLSKIDNQEIMDIAVEEQSTARQLGSVKQMCLNMAQTIDNLQSTLDRDELSGSIEHD